MLRWLALVAVVAVATGVAAAPSRRTPASESRPPLDAATQSLNNACREGSLEQARNAIRDGADINAQDVDGFSPIMAAVLNDHADIAAELIVAGADAEKPCDDGFTPIHGAAFQGRPQAARLLIDAGVDVNAAAGDGYHALHRTVWGSRPGHLETMAIFIKEGRVDPNVRQAGSLITPLHEAAMRDNVKAITQLVTLGADVNAQDSDGNTPLHITILRDNRRSFHALMQFRPDVNLHNKSGQTPLQLVDRRRQAELYQTMTAGAKDGL